MSRSLQRCVLASLIGVSWLGLAGSAHAQIGYDWVLVEGGNPADPVTGFGAVAEDYRIGVTEVTNTQYVDFLNAVAATDTNALYSTFMGSGLGGITRSGGSGSFTYSAIAGRGSLPVNNVSFYDSLRLANWLHNGQPTGAQGNTTTEDGAYTITAQGITDNSITRNAGATIFLTSEDEWYKAAYYDAVSMSYFDYPASSNTQTVCAAPGATANTANCSIGGPGDLTDVGSYTGSASPNGTFDQGGNVSEWNETIAFMFGQRRGTRGGSLATSAPTTLLASTSALFSPVNENERLGFRLARLASVPEPGTGLLGMGLLGLAFWYKRRAEGIPALESRVDASHRGSTRGGPA